MRDARRVSEEMGRNSILLETLRRVEKKVGERENPSAA